MVAIRVTPLVIFTAVTIALPADLAESTTLNSLREYTISGPSIEVPYRGVYPQPWDKPTTDTPRIGNGAKIMPNESSKASTRNSDTQTARSASGTSHDSPKASKRSTSKADKSLKSSKAGSSNPTAVKAAKGSNTLKTDPVMTVSPKAVSSKVDISKTDTQKGGTPSKSAKNIGPTVSPAAQPASSNSPTNPLILQLWTPYEIYLRNDANQRLLMSPVLADGSQRIGLADEEDEWEPLTIRFVNAPTSVFNPNFPLPEGIVLGGIAVADVEPWSSMMYLEEVSSSIEHPLPPFVARLGDFRLPEKRRDPENLVLRFGIANEETGPKVGYHIGPYTGDRNPTGLANVWSLCMVEGSATAVELYLGEAGEGSEAYCSPGFKLRAVLPRPIEY